LHHNHARDTLQTAFYRDALIDRRYVSVGQLNKKAIAKARIRPTDDGHCAGQLQRSQRLRREHRLAVAATRHGAPSAVDVMVGRVGQVLNELNSAGG
jgi:hypothetical protein